ncbi:MAG: hypothetical protein JJT82_07290 [Legionellaceae bacterium]|nr:hypothetical protein [Legionellaceae bacterium]
MKNQQGSGLAEALVAMLILSLGTMPLWHHQLRLQVRLHELNMQHGALQLAETLCNGNRASRKPKQAIDLFQVDRQNTVIHIQRQGRNGQSYHWQWPCA